MEYFLFSIDFNLGYNIKKLFHLFDSHTKISIPNNLRILVFGGALDSNCYRDKFLNALKLQKQYLPIIPDKINYFDISSEKYDLIQKETRLFENSDILIIIPESAGSFAELGMIASMINNHNSQKGKEKYAKKILILLNNQYKYDESFLKHGPVKIIKSFGGKSLNIDFNSTQYNKIFNTFKIKSNETIISLNDNTQDIKKLFYLNCIKILIFIYYHKNLSFIEYDYKNLFITKLQNIHKSVSLDNVEYLESAELISKETNKGQVVININHTHSFVQKLIIKNIDFFIKNKILQNFLTKGGY